MTIRAAYVELNLVHGEIQPTFWWLSRVTGITMDFFVLPEVAALHPLGDVAGDPRVVPIEVADPHDPCRSPFDLAELLEAGRYDVVVLGTAEPADRPGALKPLDVPQLHVIHNAHTFAPVHSGVTPCALAPHACAAVAPSALLIEPFFLGSPSDVRLPPERPVVVSVPGNVQFRRRNYPSLVRALVELREEGVGPEDLRVQIVGRALAVEPHLRGHVRVSGRKLASMLDDAGVADFVEMAPRPLTYPEVYDAVRRSHYVLPLIDEYYVPARPYLTHKHTGALGVGLGGGAVPILSERFAATAAHLDAGPRYRGDDVASGLRAALSRTACDHLGERAAVVTRRDERLAASAERFSAWLERAC